LVFYPSGRISIGGSLHKYHNNGEHNLDQYSAESFQETLERLEREIFVTPNNIRITRMEHGVNIIPPVPCGEIINHCFQHKGANFEEKISRIDGKYHCVKHDTHEFKLYDKGLQFKMPNQLLRIEDKVTNWSNHRKNGLITLEDFHRADKTPFVINLIQRWNEVLFADPTTEYPIKWHKYTNREYWRDLRSGNRTTFNRHLQKMRLLSRTSGSNIQEQVSNLIQESIYNLQPVTNTTFM
jgi:hypothetical protein